MCLAPYRQSYGKTSISLSNALIHYAIKKESNAQLMQKTRGENKVHASREKCWPLLGLLVTLVRLLCAHFESPGYYYIQGKAVNIRMR